MPRRRCKLRGKRVAFLLYLLAGGLQLLHVVEELCEVLFVLRLLRLVAGDLLLCFREFVAEQRPVRCCDGQSKLQHLALLLQGHKTQMMTGHGSVKAQQRSQ
jgi:hypothetical protein